MESRVISRSGEGETHMSRNMIHCLAGLCRLTPIAVRWLPLLLLCLAACASDGVQSVGQETATETVSGPAAIPAVSTTASA